MLRSTGILSRAAGMAAGCLVLGCAFGYVYGSRRAAAAEAPLPVTFFGHDAVAAGFRKGGILFKDPSRNYQIHTSHRDGPGTAELHEQDTDIFYIQKGTAVFVTGGKMIDPKEAEPGEFRGSGIEGGQDHPMSKGDVIIVPHGTPHWFREVKGPFDYFTVKVR